MSQATIAARPPHEHGALLSRPDPQPPQPAYRDRRADRGACCSTASAAPACAIPSAASAREARAAREVVVSAGSINSPQLLELSGIGQPERLRGARHRGAPRAARRRREPARPLRAAHALAGRHEGHHLQRRARGLGLVHQALRYALFRQGPAGAWSAAPIRAFVRSREGLEAPDLLLGWVPMLTEPGPKGPRISRQSGMTCYAHPMRPESKGHIHITSADPRRPPAINFNFLSSPLDARADGARRSASPARS